MFDSLLFLYFVTLHADQLSVPIGGFSIRLNNLIALTIFILFFVRLRHKLFRIDKTLCIALLILTASLSISFLLSPYKSRCLFFLAWYSFVTFTYFLLPYFLMRYYNSKKVFSLYLASFLVVGAYALLQLIFSLVGFNDPFAKQFIIGAISRPNALSYEPSFYALYMTPFVVMINFHYLLDPNRPFFLFSKIDLKWVILVNFLFFISTATSALFAFGIMCLALTFYMWNHRLENFATRFIKYLFALTALFALAGLAFPFLMRQFFLKFFFEGFMDHHSFFERWVGIENAWRIFCERPYFGVGLGGYPNRLFDAYLSESSGFTFIQSSILVADAPNPLKCFEAMNVLTETLASVGLVGGLAFCVFVFVILWRAKKAAIVDPTRGYTLFLSVLVMIIALQFNQGLFRTYVWVHLSLSFALAQTILEGHSSENKRAISGNSAVLA